MSRSTKLSGTYQVLVRRCRQRKGSGSRAPSLISLAKRLVRSDMGLCHPFASSLSSLRVPRCHPFVSLAVIPSPFPPCHPERSEGSALILSSRIFQLRAGSERSEGAALFRSTIVFLLRAGSERSEGSAL